MAAAVYTQEQASQFLAHIDIPPKYRLENNPARDYAFLKAMHVHMITAVPYENLLLHYSQERKVDMSPQTVFNKIVGKETRGRGGYCMENSVFFFHMLKALGFRVFPVGAKVKPRVNGVPTGDYSGWVHIVNIVTFPDGSRWTSDVAFGGDGPTEPIELKDGASIVNLGTQDARLTRGFIPGQSEQDDLERRWWIYECRNGEDKPWHSFYCFSDRVEWLAQDFGVSNWFTGHSPESFQTTTVLAVKFLRRPKTMNAKEEQNGDEDGVQEVYGKVMLVNEAVKENLGGRTRLLQECKSERERIEALKQWFGIELDEEEQRAIDGFKTAIR